MNVHLEKFNQAFDNKKILNYLFYSALLIICVLKIPPVFSTDIQPWDEGMYALRVLSIYINGDFFDQSSHSTGGFYSGSHPPLLIWIGYFISLITGLNSPTLKLIIFAFSIASLFLIYKTSSELFDRKVGLLATLIFSSTIIFNVFSKRFQFDIPYTFFILLSVYLMLNYNRSGSVKYLYSTGVVFGLCLMVKIIVGILIPIVFMISYYFLKDRFKVTVKDILLFSLIGIIIAAPWHIYMIVTHGYEFLSYFFGFHIIERAFSGLEHNNKSSGLLYYINYLLNIIPFSVLIFYSLVTDFKKIRKLSWQKVFLWVWFLTGFVIITIFKTKLEVYILLILTPGVMLLADFILSYEFDSFRKKFIAALLLLFNLIWYFTDTVRHQAKEVVLHSDFLIILLVLGVSVILLTAVAFLVSKINRLKPVLILFVVLTFLISNIKYLIDIPSWENTYNISELKLIIDSYPASRICYIASDYRYNPQLSFYFEGADVDWTKSGYNITMLDTKNGTDSIRSDLSEYKDETFVIVEKDNINRADYPASELFIPGNYRLIYKTRGYELYSNN
ncbi:MAG: glycosyltransferase family 39 protein [Ignavibacteriaceae bacterium]|jgi:4-amino-4-deoxy-L-arabinose transferase-like glycosyltransferase|nr:MAG: Undecaprenyl phosphate-alpha-4-amino-4-deoxy-L-arabinose arabinosyl transferase [Chlorobi bacterium OLB4]MBW7855250.1 glycosyltransferase family 39 protein [Ignavibacteria bacterium]MEB2329532.1 glycosyltransferase family 39 protein [Ignavibacteriaceae bacterium]OQY77829.1 MAG: hypothetical protein B6D43_04785 [Ignavibacteriales bacterium UTCHB1]